MSEQEKHENGDIETVITRTLADAEPEIDVIAVQRSGGVLQVFVDHPDGVTLDVCERVSGHLSEINEKWSLEVSSPGPERPLTRPEHFRRFIGRRIRVRTVEGIEGQRNFVGELVAADDEKIGLNREDDPSLTTVEIPLAWIGRSNLAPNIQGGTA